MVYTNSFLYIGFFILIVTLVIIYKKQLLTLDSLSNSIDKLENYKNKYLENSPSNKTGAPIKYNLEEVLEKYNKLLIPSSIELAHKKYIYPNNSAPTKLLNGTKNLITLFLSTIRENTGLNMQLLDIENIVELKNMNGSRKINVIFVAHEIDQHYTRKLILEYILENSGQISINNLSTISKDPNVLLSEQYIKDNIADKNYTISYDSNIFPTLDNSIYPFYYRNEDKKESSSLPSWVYQSPQLIKDIDSLKKVCITQEPCKYTMNSWNTKSVEPQVTIDKKCNITNHSDRLLPADPYVNPTIFQIDY